MLTAERLRELVAYDPETGAFTWRRRMGSRALVGALAGSATGCGYWCIRLDKKLYQAHRLAWLYVHGCWPVHDIDHINGARMDNRIANLRDVPNAINRENTLRARQDSKTGVQGVSPYKKTGRFQAQIRVHGKHVFLGVFDTSDQAAQAYRDAKAQLHSGWTGERPTLLTDNHAVNQSGKRRVRCDSKTGFPGVQRHADGRFRARITVDGRTKHLGLFNTPEAAHSAFMIARAAVRG